MILICNEYFYMTKIICARNIQTVFDIKPKLWLQIWYLGSGFSVKSVQTWITDIGFWVLDLETQARGFGFWILVSRSWVLLHSKVTTKCDKNLLKSVPENYWKDITNYERYYKKCDRNYKMWQLLQSET